MKLGNGVGKNCSLDSLGPLQLENGGAYVIKFRYKLPRPFTASKHPDSKISTNSRAFAESTLLGFPWFYGFTANSSGEKGGLVYTMGGELSAFYLLCHIPPTFPAVQHQRRSFDSRR